MDNQGRNTGIYLVGIIIMFGILIVIGNQLLNNRNRPVNISLNLAKPTLTINPDNTYLANIATNRGSFTIELCSKCAPQNVNNFIYLSNKEYYKATKFHRIVSNLLIQGGDRNTLTSDISSYGKGKTAYLIPDEVNWDSINLSQEKKEKLLSEGFTSNTSIQSIPLEKYSVAMANDGPNTNSSQFFIILADESDSRVDELKGYFTVIGKVTSGYETLETLNATTTVEGSYLPSSDLIIEKIEIIQK